MGPNDLPILFSFLRWRYQNRFHTYNQHLGMSPANSKSLLWVRPSNNINLAGNLGNSRPPRVRGQSFRTGHNMPFNSTLRSRILVHHRNIEM